MDWKPIDTMPHKTWVLVARLSGYIDPEWDILVAKMDPDFRDEIIDISRDRISDSGSPVMFWTALPTGPQQ